MNNEAYVNEAARIMHDAATSPDEIRRTVEDLREMSSSGMTLERELGAPELFIASLELPQRPGRGSVSRKIVNIAGLVAALWVALSLVLIAGLRFDPPLGAVFFTTTPALLIVVAGLAIGFAYSRREISRTLSR